ncbi:unnamed protein product [Calicophoron daubneyi]|uniref:BHLH domain-containing protein n=1 Tax=Calicophoron daubneyi TaxID=300641 RepID=A0AAV2TH30_CALDB
MSLFKSQVKVTDTRKPKSFVNTDQENLHHNLLAAQHAPRRPLAELNREQSNNGFCQQRRKQLPSHQHAVGTKSGFIPVSKRNERERNRVKLLNLGFDRLRAVVPSQSGEQLSKISTLRKAIWYIEHLDRVLHGQEQSEQLGDGNKTDTLTKKSTPISTRGVNVKPSPSSISHSGFTSSGAELASRIASWSSPEQSVGIHQTTLGGRPANQKVPSPVFPTHWGVTGLDISSTPRTTQTWCTFDAGFPFGESGYHSNASIQSTSEQEATPSRTILHQSLFYPIDSYENTG